MVNKEIIKEKKTGFNIIDLIIVLFVLLAVVGIAWRFNFAEKININATGETFEIEFYIQNIQEASQDFLQPGESFYITIESIEIGKIDKIIEIRNPSLFYDRDKNGNIVRTENPGRIDVTGIMISQGRVTKDGGYMINGNTYVAANKEYLVHTERLEVTITVQNIKKIN